MAALAKDDVLKKDVLAVSEWAEKYGNNCSNQTVQYLITKGILDYIQMGRFKYVVLTEHTLAYVQAKRPQTATMETKKNG